MANFYHMHPKLATTVTGECRTAGTQDHHSSCSQSGFTHANEVSCDLRPGTVPPETACKCVHNLPAGAKVPRGFKRVVTRKRKPKAKAKSGKKKRKAKAK